MPACLVTFDAQDVVEPQFKIPFSSTKTLARFTNVPVVSVDDVEPTIKYVAVVMLFCTFLSVFIVAAGNVICLVVYFIPWVSVSIADITSNVPP